MYVHDRNTKQGGVNDKNSHDGVLECMSDIHFS